MRWIFIDKIFCHGILKNKNNEFLILKRSNKDIYPFLWDLPGGEKMENESFMQCLVREFMEETNLKVCGANLKYVKIKRIKEDNIIVLIYETIVDEIKDVFLNDEHISFVFVKNFNSQKTIWYLQDLI